MKQHSYAFCKFVLLSYSRTRLTILDNGHLSENFKMRNILKTKLKSLENIHPADTALTTSSNIAPLSTAYLDQQPSAMGINRRRQSRRTSFGTASSTINQVASAIDSKQPLDLATIQMFERIIEWEIDALTVDLKGKSTREDNLYPAK